MATLELRVHPLTQQGFAEFGEVIETDGRDSFLINDGRCRRFHDLADVDVSRQNGRPLINIFRTAPVAPPVAIHLLERHPLGSQAFVSLSSRPFLVVVASGGETVTPEAVRAFVTNGRQGVNYRGGIWHHPLLALGGTSDFLVVDRGGNGDNYEEFRFDSEAPEIVISSLPAAVAEPADSSAGAPSNASRGIPTRNAT